MRQLSYSSVATAEDECILHQESWEVKQRAPLTGTTMTQNDNQRHPIVTPTFTELDPHEDKLDGTW